MFFAKDSYQQTRQTLGHKFGVVQENSVLNCQHMACDEYNIAMILSLYDTMRINPGLTSNELLLLCYST